ncbi:hypothetical protein, partial [Williamsia sp. 1135]|uniref:hypothetical protein n=1 Tax=Williamsia sp. 1135 TaxID=1889262 RepID=UPI00197FE485
SSVQTTRAACRAVRVRLAHRLQAGSVDRADIAAERAKDAVDRAAIAVFAARSPTRRARSAWWGS